MNINIRLLIVTPVLCALLFGCVGPPVGSLAITIPDIVRGDLVDPTGALLAGAFFSYIYGALPALATGLSAGLLIRMNGFLLCVSCGAIGAGTSFLFFKLTAKPYLYDFLTAFYRVAVPGFFGGLFCGILVYIAYKMANYSFKRTPG